MKFSSKQLAAFAVAFADLHTSGTSDRALVRAMTRFCDANKLTDAEQVYLFSQTFEREFQNAKA